mmetsp:Transcript_21322/g.38986  ORF Transcript_21322/g.38986 Transcript_21322/m.38986 type:complete len:308 (+) Transcript_21322:50-973(+)
MHLPVVLSPLAIVLAVIEPCAALQLGHNVETPCTTHVVSTFFTQKGDWQDHGEHVEPKFRKIAGFYRSVLSTPNVHVVILYDKLPKNFTARYTHLGKFEFQMVNLTAYDALLGVNDVRFVVFRDFLHTRPDYSVVFFTDLFDVKVLRNPCPLVMQRSPRKIFVGSEVQHSLDFKWMRKRFEDMGGKYLEWYRRATQKDKAMVIFNAGLLGGRRGQVMAFLENLAAVEEDSLLLTRQRGHEVDVNMGAFNWVVYQHTSRNQRVTGHPLHSDFGANRPLPHDIFKHKLLSLGSGTSPRREDGEREHWMT